MEPACVQSPRGDHRPSSAHCTHPWQQQLHHAPPPHPAQEHPPQQQHEQHMAGYPPPPCSSRPSLPAFQQPYPPPGAPQEQLNRLTSLGHTHDAQEAPEYHQYNQHKHAGHATPAPVNRSYSIDSSHPQRTPTTPAQPAVYPPSYAPGGAHPHMEDHGYPPTNGLTHGHLQPSQGLPPPQRPSPRYEPHNQFAMTPVMNSHNGYAPAPPMYAQAPGCGPAVAININVQRKKQMRATQACEQCRSRKQKCFEGNPCSFCKESNLQCQGDKTRRRYSCS